MPQTSSKWTCYVLMACVAQLEQVLDDGYLGVRIGSELEVDASCGEDVQ
jgi:hypothetical protein